MTDVLIALPHLVGAQLICLLCKLSNEKLFVVSSVEEAGFFFIILVFFRKSLFNVYFALKLYLCAVDTVIMHL